jgi:hypothetical protein
MGPVPPEQRAAAQVAIRAKDAPEMDLVIEQAMKNSPTAAWAITHGKHPPAAGTCCGRIVSTPRR